MGWESDLNVAGCWLPVQSWSDSIVKATGDLTYDTTCGILTTTVSPELYAANIVLDGVLLASKGAIDNFYQNVRESSALKLAGKFFTIVLCLMAFFVALS